MHRGTGQKLNTHACGPVQVQPTTKVVSCAPPQCRRNLHAYLQPTPVRVSAAGRSAAERLQQQQCKQTHTHAMPVKQRQQAQGR